MSNVSLRGKAYALIECSLRKNIKQGCKGCIWDDEVCEEIECGESEGVKREVIQRLLEEIDRLENENAVLRERIAIMEVEREDDLK